MTTSSPQVKYAFALNSEGTIISADSASRGEDYSCPGCAGVMIPVLGSQKARHFRHFRECCSYESYLHKCGKVAFYHFYDEALQLGKPVKLELERDVLCSGPRLDLLRKPDAECRKVVSACYDLTNIFTQVGLEKFDTLAGFRPDVMLYDSDLKRRCYVEICVTHSCTQDKIDSKIPILEFQIRSDADINRLLTGSYSIKDNFLRTFNWQPSSKTVVECKGKCSFGSEEMSVWGLSHSGRINEQILKLEQVNLATSSILNTWPRATDKSLAIQYLKAFLRHADPISSFPICVICKFADKWESGYLNCLKKTKLVPYTEARHCMYYEQNE